MIPIEKPAVQLPVMYLEMSIVSVVAIPLQENVFVTLRFLLAWPSPGNLLSFASTSP